MNNFHSYITPEEAAAHSAGDFDVEHYRKLQKKTGTCQVCDEKVWRYGGCGLCFSCTTGEADASDDFELTEP